MDRFSEPLKAMLKEKNRSTQIVTEFLDYGVITNGKKANKLSKSLPLFVSKFFTFLSWFSAGKH